MKKIVIFFLVFFIFSCTKDSDKITVIDPGDVSSIPEDSYTYSTSFELYKNLVKSGFTECEAFTISKGALLSAKDDVVNTPGDLNWQNINIVIPALIKGAVEVLSADNLTDIKRIDAVYTLNHTLIFSLKGRLDALNNSEKAMLIGSIAENSVKSLPLAGTANSAQLQSFTAGILTGSISVLDEINLSNEGIAFSIKSINSGAMKGVFAIKDTITDIAGNLSAVISGASAASVGSLNNLGLMQQQKTYSAKLAVSGIALEINNSTSLTSDEKKQILIDLVRASIGAFDKAQFHVLIIPHAISGILDGVYKAINDETILNDLKNAASLGYNDLDYSLLPGSEYILEDDATLVGLKDTSINNYTAGYDDPFVNTMPDCTAIADAEKHNGVWLTDDNRIITVINNGGCWIIADSNTTTVYKGVIAGSFSYKPVMGSFTDFIQFTLTNAATGIFSFNATFAAFIPKTLYAPYNRNFYGICNTDTFVAQENAIRNVSYSVYSDVILSFSNNDPTVGTGLGGLGGISTVLTTLDDNSPIDDTVPVNVGITGFFATDSCAVK